MSNARNEKILALFHRALELPSGERERFVADEAGDDIDLRDSVLEYLRFAASVDGMLDVVLSEHLDVETFIEALPPRIGDFEILGVLARGATSVVCRARRVGTTIDIALKILLPRADEEGKPNLLRREIVALSQLDHRGVARLLDSGTFPSRFGAAFYLAMEFVDGVALPQYLAAAKPDLPRRIELLAALCDIVDDAHVHGVVHRDIKPDNILIRPDGSPVLLDFGLARFAPKRTTTPSMASRIGSLVGTVRYMSPEQARADATIQPASDIYTLGVLGFELLTGELPYALADDNIPGSIVAINKEEPALAGRVNPALRGGIERALTKALAKDPSARQKRAGDLGRALREAARAPARRGRLAFRRRWIGLGMTAAGLLALLLATVFRDAGIDGSVLETAAVRAPIEVVVMDPGTGAVLATTTAGGDGRFRIRNLSRGREIVVRAQAGRHFAATREPALRSGERRTLELRLHALPLGCGAESLVAWWPADGDLADVAGGHAAASAFPIAYTAGADDRAFVFDDSCPSGLRVADAGAFRGVRAFTIEAWVRPTYDTDARVNDLDGIFGKAVGCDRVGMAFSLTMFKKHDESRIVLWMPDSTGIEIDASDPRAVIPRDVLFHHIAATFDGATAKIYVDGQSVSEVANPHVQIPDAGRLRIGHHPECSAVTFSSIDELRFFRRALAPDEIAAIHASGRSSTPAP